MKNLLILALLAGGVYGVYRAFEAYSGGAVDRATKEVSGGHLKRAQRKLEMSGEKMGKVNVSIVQDAVNRFHGEKGRYPASLDEVVQSGYLDSVPGGVTYDSATGAVSGS